LAFRIAQQRQVIQWVKAMWRVAEALGEYSTPTEDIQTSRFRADDGQLGSCLNFLFADDPTGTQKRHLIFG
jgi:hypothetical protein